MDSDNQNYIYCADDDECRIYCYICDKFAIDRYYNNHLKSQVHNNEIPKGQDSINTKT